MILNGTIEWIYWINYVNIVLVNSSNDSTGIPEKNMPISYFIVNKKILCKSYHLKFKKKTLFLIKYCYLFIESRNSEASWIIINFFSYLKRMKVFDKRKMAHTHKNCYMLNNSSQANNYRIGNASLFILYRYFICNGFSFSFIQCDWVDFKNIHSQPKLCSKVSGFGVLCLCTLLWNCFK